MAKKQTLLSNLVDLLVQEWGYEHVERELNRYALRSRSLKFEETLHRESGVRSSNRKKKSTSPANDLISKAEIPDEKKFLIQELALRFDRKDFLPSAGDVREFLLMSGASADIPKDRKSSFRKILHALMELPAPRLESIVKSTRHSGPSRLAPLSDAISTAAASSISRRQSLDDTSEKKDEIRNEEEDIKR